MTMPIAGHSWPPDWWENVKDADGAGHALSTEAAYHLAERARKAVPVTRVHRLTDLGSVKIPVWAAVTPCTKDLTVHLGKGSSDTLAELSAIFEGIERFSAENVPAHQIVSADEDIDLRREVIRRLRLPHIEAELLSDQWVHAWDLIRHEHISLPAKTVLSPVVVDGVYRADTTGLASGGHHIEAVLHGIYELIERDAVAALEFDQQFGNRSRRYRPQLLHLQEHPELASIIDRITYAGFSISAFALDAVGRTATYCVYLIDRIGANSIGHPSVFMGAGSAKSGSRALTRAVCEAVQSYAGFTLGARETFEGWSEDIMDDEEKIESRQTYLLNLLDATSAPPERSAALSGPEYDSLLEELENLIDRLRDDGAEDIFIADLTRPDLRVPVIRAVIPCLARPHGATLFPTSLRLYARMLDYHV